MAEDTSRRVRAGWAPASPPLPILHLPSPPQGALPFTLLAVSHHRSLDSYPNPLPLLPQLCRADCTLQLSWVRRLGSNEGARASRGRRTPAAGRAGVTLTFLAHGGIFSFFRPFISNSFQSDGRVGFPPFREVSGPSQNYRIPSRPFFFFILKRSRTEAPGSAFHTFKSFPPDPGTTCLPGPTSYNGILSSIPYLGYRA